MDATLGYCDWGTLPRRSSELTECAGLTRSLKRFAGENLAEWMPDTPHAAGPVPKTQRAGAKAIYFPACISRVMGRLPGEPRDRSLMEVTVELGRRAGVPLHIPADAAGTCCGTPFSSKGFSSAHAITINAGDGAILEVVGAGKTAHRD